MKKISLLFSAILLSLSLASCADNTGTNVSSTAKFTYNADEIAPNTVEDVVNATYDSVVSVKSVINSYSYSSGSGTFIGYDEDLNLSYVLTCYHVIDGGASYSITLSDLETSLPAQLVGGDPANDIALLSVEGLDYTYATIPEESSLRLGSQIVVIGNPLGTLPGSVTSGYISYLNRPVVSEDYRTMSLIQTDASINQGNSGGAMFDMLGRIVGVVNAKYVDEGVEGLGFAIPIEDAMAVVNSVLETAKYDGSTWSTKGYYVGAYEFGFSLTDAASFFGSSYVVVSGVSNNSTTSGYNSFMLYDEVRAVSITKQDDSTTDISFTNSQSLLQQLYNSNLTIGDSLSFTIVRNRVESTVEFSICQFIPQ